MRQKAKQGRVCAIVPYIHGAGGRYSGRQAKQSRKCASAKVLGVAVAVGTLAHPGLPGSVRMPISGTPQYRLRIRGGACC